MSIQNKINNLTLNQLKKLHIHVNERIIELYDLLEKNMDPIFALKDKIKECDEISYLLDEEDQVKHLHNCIRETSKHSFLIDYIDAYIRANKKIINQIDEDGNNLFTIACYEIDLNRDILLPVLEQNGTNVHHRNLIGWNGLMCVCSTCKTDPHRTIEMMIQYNVDINYKDINGWDALLLLCSNPIKYNTSIELLLRSGADPNSKTKSGRSGLIILCNNFEKKKCYSTIELLLKYGADPNITIENKTLFYHVYHSTMTHDIELFGLLIQYGAEINYKIDKVLKTNLIERGYLKSKSKQLLNYLNSKIIIEGNCPECFELDTKVVEIKSDYHICFNCLYKTNFYN